MPRRHVLELGQRKVVSRAIDGRYGVTSDDCDLRLRYLVDHVRRGKQGDEKKLRKAVVVDFLDGRMQMRSDRF
jgi:hypothetical protein